MPATSCCTRLAAPARLRSSAPGCWSSGLASSAHQVLLYLAAAGMGTLGVIDDDAVSLSNLQRQVVHATGDVGRPKVESAVAALGPPQSSCGHQPHAARLTAANALDVVSRYDLVADGSDNFATRYLVADACYFARKPAGDRGGRRLRRDADHHACP